MAKVSVSPQTEVAERGQLAPLYRVVLLDDSDHTYDSVIEMLQKISSLSWSKLTRVAAVLGDNHSYRTSRAVVCGS
jgi:hypothetical protein